MIFRNRWNEPKSLLALAMMCLAVAILWPNLFHPVTQLGKNLTHFACGMLLGISLAINLRALWMKRRQRLCGESEGTQR